jgi:hypothetical protein
MTPEDFGDLANGISPNLDEIKSFLRDASARDIQRFIHRLNILAKPDTFNFARVALNVRLAEDAEKTTRRLVTLTWVIVALTSALLAFTVALYEESRAQIQHDQLKSNRQPTQP